MNKLLKYFLILILILTNIMIVLDFYYGIISTLNFNILLKTIIIYGLVDIISFTCIGLVIYYLVKVVDKDD